MQAWTLLMEGCSNLKSLKPSNSLLSRLPNKNLLFFSRNSTSTFFSYLLTNKERVGHNFSSSSTPWSLIQSYQSSPFCISSLTFIRILPKWLAPFPATTPQNCSFSPPYLKVLIKVRGKVATNLPPSYLLRLNLSLTILYMTLNLLPAQSWGLLMPIAISLTLS